MSPRAYPVRRRENIYQGTPDASARGDTGFHAVFRGVPSVPVNRTTRIRANPRLTLSAFEASVRAANI